MHGRHVHSRYAYINRGYTRYRETADSRYRDTRDKTDEGGTVIIAGKYSKYSFTRRGYTVTNAILIAEDSSKKTVYLQENKADRIILSVTRADIPD